MSDFYILVGDQESGPFALNELEAMVQNGEISVQSMYARPGMTAWEPLSSVVRADAGPQLRTTEEHDSASLEKFPTTYDNSRYESLMDAFRGLSSYRAVDEWDSRAKEEVTKMLQVLRGLDAAVERESWALEQAKREFASKSFLQKTFANHEAENEISARVAGLRQRKVQLLQWVAQLQEAIDFTPNTPAQREALLKELRQRKKELQVQKREEAAVLAEIRREARVESAGAGIGWLGIYNPDLAADQRRGIRYAKEAALRPHEDTKTALERQLRKVERDLMWVERISE